MKRTVNIRAAIVITFIVLLCIGSVFAALPHLLQPETTYTAYLYHEGQLIHTRPLSSENSSQQFLVGDYDDAYNLIEISADSIRIKEASCPDQICVKQGPIHNALVPIPCLPTHLVIELKTEPTVENDLDAVTH